MCGDELRQRVRPFSALDRIRVVERLDELWGKLGDGMRKAA